MLFFLTFSAVIILQNEILFRKKTKLSDKTMAALSRPLSDSFTITDFLSLIEISH